MRKLTDFERAVFECLPKEPIFADLEDITEDIVHWRNESMDFKAMCCQVIKAVHAIESWAGGGAIYQDMEEYDKQWLLEMVGIKQGSRFGKYRFQLSAAKWKEVQEKYLQETTTL